MSPPIETLTAQQTLDHQTMWHYLRRLRDRLFDVPDSHAVMDDCLDILVDLFGADRGLILLFDPDGTTRTVNARGQGKSLTAAEREETSKTVIREALESGQCIVWDPMTLRTRPQSAAFRIVVALAAPLQWGSSRDQVRGVLYLDVRDRRKFVGERHVEFFMSAAVLLCALLEQHGREWALLRDRAPLGVAWQRLQQERGKLDEHEQALLRQALAQSGGVVAQAARELGVARTTLSSRIDALGIRTSRRFEPPK